MFRLTVALIFISLTAFATTQVAASLESLSQGADAIVHGTVVESHARKTQDGLRIITDTTIKISESLKGSAAGQVVVMQPGGVVGDIGQRVEGVATFVPGEEVVVFLEKKSDTRFAVLGMAQGKFKLEKSSDGKATFAIPAAPQAGMLVDAETHQPVATPLTTLELSQLKTQIKKSLKAETPKPLHP